MKVKTLFLILLLLAVSLNKIKAESASKDKEYTLSECIDLAIENLPEISAASSRVRQQEENRRAIRTLRFPTLDTEFEYNRLPESIPQKKKYLGDSLNDFQADIILKQPLYTGGKTAARAEAARYGLEAAEKEYLAAVNSAVYKVKVSYYKLLYASYMLNSRKELLESMQWFYETSLDLNRKTKIPREEMLLRIEVQLNQVRQNLIAAEQNYKAAQKNLLASMGMDISDEINISSLPDTLVNEAGYSQEMAMKAPEIDAAGSRINEARATTREIKSGNYPGVSAFLSYGYEWPGLEEGDTRWTAGGAMSFPLWNWGRINAEVNRSKERALELEAVREDLINSLELAFESARLKYKSALGRFEIASKNIDLAKRSLGMFEKRYNNTTATSIELLDSQKALSETQEAYAASLLDLRTSAAEIERITGEYLENK